MEATSFCASHDDSNSRGKGKQGVAVDVRAKVKWRSAAKSAVSKGTAAAAKVSARWDRRKDCSGALGVPWHTLQACASGRVPDPKRAAARPAKTTLVFRHAHKTPIPPKHTQASHLVRKVALQDSEACTGGRVPDPQRFVVRPAHNAPISKRTQAFYAALVPLRDSQACAGG